jgi:tol-pal system protein YbgF
MKPTHTTALKAALKAAPFAAVLLAVTMAFAAQAQTPMPDPLDDRSVKRLEKMEKVVRELRSIVFQGRDSGKPVVVQDAETGPTLEALTDRVTDLEQSLMRNTAAGEALTFELDRSRKALEASQASNKALTDRVAALEQRLAALEAAATQSATEEQQAAAEEAADPDAVFAQGRRLMAEGDYAGAETAFDTYVTSFGDAPKAPEARYWLGKTLTARGANGKAASAYIGAIRGWPKTTWAPDAVVELARALIAQKLPTDACQALAELPRRYPNASPSVTTRAAAARTQAKCAA